MAEPLDEPVTPASTPDASGAAVLDTPAPARSLSAYDGPAIDIAGELRTSYLGYAMSTIVSRALPDVRDGLKPVQRRILYAMRELGLSPNSRHLKSAKVVGECFVAGTRVATPTGLRRIEDLQVGDVVCTQSGVRAVTEAYVMPEQPLLDVELGSGRNVFCTPGQRFKVLMPDLSTIWKRADELVLGDNVVTRGGTTARDVPASASYPTVDGVGIDEDMAYLLGFFLADGWVDPDNKRGYRRLAFAAVERAIIERIQDILTRKFGVTASITGRGNIFNLRVNNSALNRLIINTFGLEEKRAGNISVPEVLFDAQAEVLYSFVSGFSDGDASVHKSRNMMVLTTISRPFLHDLSVLLFARSIHSRLLPYDKVGGNTEYALEIGSRSLHELGQNLTHSHPVKAERLAAILASGNYQPEKATKIPYLGALLLNEFREKHLGGGCYAGAGGEKVRSGLKYANGVKIRYSSEINESFVVSMDSLNTVGLLAKMTSIGSRYLDLLTQWERDGVAFHPVRAVRPAASEVTYDIQVEGEHEFVANGMIVHNCMGNFHPHGDQALYGTMVRMAQPFSLRYPMVDGQGNFGCFTGDTKIKLLDGTEKSFAELSTLPEGEIFHVYSADKHGRIVVGEGRHSRVTRSNASLVRVTLDNGATIRCTPDHRFLLRNGEYKEARHLTPEDSFLAGYFDTAPVKPGLNPYLRVQQPITGEWEFVHWLADEFNADRGISSGSGKAFVRHHINFNHFDNRPSNIDRMGFLEHLHLHAEHMAALWEDPAFRETQHAGVVRYYNDNPQARESRRKHMIEQNTDPAFRAANGARVAPPLRERYANDPEARAILSERMKALWADDEYRAKMSDALSGIEKRPLTVAQRAEVSRVVGEKSRAMWSDDAKREEIIAAIVSAMASPELRERLRENARAMWQDPAYRARFSPTHHKDMATTLWSRPETREMHREKVAGQWQEESFRVAQRDGVRISNARRLVANLGQMHEIAQHAATALKVKWQDDSYRQRVIRGRVCRYVSGLIARHGAGGVTPEVYESGRDGGWIPRLPNALTYFDDFDEIVRVAQTYNHRIVRVEAIEDTEDVYDITVDEHHNFLLSDGVFVHNSVDDDPPAAMRYCITANNLVVTADGLVPAGALATTEDISTAILSLDGKVNTASKWFDCGVFPVRTVRTRRGYEVTGTTNHPLLVCTPDGDKRTSLVWKTIADLSVGDYVVLDRSETLFPDAPIHLAAHYPRLSERSTATQHDLPTHLDADFAFLLGALVAEGTCRSSCVEFCHLPGNYADEFALAWARVFPTCRLHMFNREPTGYGKKPFLQMQCVSQHVIGFLNALGLRGKSAERLVPDVVLRSPQAVVSAFLRGLYEGDGAVERSGRSLLRVNLCAKSRAMLRQVQTALLRFGIVSTLNAEVKRGTYRLLIVGEDNLRRFADKIGFVSEAKRAALADASATYTTGRALSQTDFMPFLADFVRDNAARGNRERLGKNNFDRPDRLGKALPRLAQDLPAADSAHVESLARNRYLFEPVVAIEDAGEQNVYSIRVDSECHSFVANGFINHNTEARLTAVAMEMMEDIEKDTVDFKPTYDNERREPTVLPGKFPYLVCNGGSGIAVGMATNMPPHNLREICDASVYLLEHSDASIEQLMQYVPGPDFPTAGLILGSKGIKAAYHTGRGQVTMQAKTTIEPMDGGKHVIVISELPYQVIKKKLEEQIGDLVKEKKIDGITAVRDYSDKSGMRLVVELRRDVMPQKILNYLLKHTPLRLNFGVMMISLAEAGTSPKTLSLKTILQEYLDHRRDIITRRTRFELARAKARAHILEGLQIAVQFLDEVIVIIRASNSTEQARSRLIERFLFSGLQAEAILNMQLRQLTSLEQGKIEDEFKDLLKEIGRFEDILMDPRRVNMMIKADLKYLKDKFGDDRRTKIIPTEAEEINIEDLIAEEEMLITVTRDGYIKRLDFGTFRSQKRGGRGVSAGKTREEDNFELLFRASTHDYILFFTDRGRVYRLKAFEVPQTSRQAMGTAIINLINIQPDEKITATVPIRDFRTAEGFLLMVTERGEIKRTAVAEYANLRANGLVTFDLEDNDALKWVKHTPGTAEVILTTVRGMAIRFPEDKVPTRGRAAGGVRGIMLDSPDDKVVSADVVIGDADAQELLVISELGLGKRTPLAAYRSQGRGGKGLITMNLSGDRTGKCLMVATVVSKESEPNLRLLIVTENGVMIRMKAEEIKTTAGRSTSGVRLINLGEGDRVKTAEVIDLSKNAEEVEDV